MPLPPNPTSLNEASARYILIDPALEKAGWRLSDRTQVGYEIPVDGYDAMPWNGVPRIPVLRIIRARVRFLSVEPLLEDLGNIDLNGIQWVIVGGESGWKARPMKPAWVESVKRQCDEARVAFFFKRWGTWGADGEKRSKHANGRRYRGRLWDAMPQLVLGPMS